jgi:hypothetical protein
MSATAQLPHSTPHSTHAGSIEPTPELVDYFTKVFIDGRFLQEAVTDPSGVSKKLGVALSPEAHHNILTTNGLNNALKEALAHLKNDRPNVRNALVVAVIVIVFPGLKPNDDAIDDSGETKF